MRKITYSYSRGASKQDEALECYGRAANMYKMAKKWSAAGNTFCTIANHHVKVGNVSISNLELGLPKSSVLNIAHLISKNNSQFGNKHDAATNYVDAANCYKKNDPKEAAASLQKVLQHFHEKYRVIFLI